MGTATSTVDYAVKITPENDEAPRQISDFSRQISDFSEMSAEDLAASEALTASEASLGPVPPIGKPAPPSPRLLNASFSTSITSSGTLRDLVQHSSASSDRSLTKSERHNSRRYSAVDMSMVRGVSLRRSLQGFGRLWRFDPLRWHFEQRSALYALSSPVESFDVFISHTWLTSGRRKILSLWLQSGWRCALVFWCAGVLVTFALCAADILPLPLSYEATILPGIYPMGCWVVLGSMTATVLGMISAPYWPDRCSRRDRCFIDVASIHQVDQKLMERGVYGIAGFLRISRELRILFSAPYFSRLWCVFEVAAYKKLNPSGRITFRPLLFEAVVVWLLMSSYCFSFALLIWRRLGADGHIADAWAAMALATWFVAISVASYLLRMLFREKHHLLIELEEFDLDSVQCSKQFDRDFIHSAIVKWYGSKQAFTNYVRGCLKEELVCNLFAAKLPREYQLLILTGPQCLGLEILLASWKGGASRETLLTYCIAVLVGLFVLWMGAAVMLMMYLCDLFAQRRFGALDHLQTLAIVCLITGFVSAGTQLAIFALESQWIGSLLYLAAAIVICVSVKWLEGKRAPQLPSKPAQSRSDEDN